MTKSEAIQKLHSRFVERGVDTPYKIACDMVIHCGVNEPKSYTFSNRQTVTVERQMTRGVEGYAIWWTQGKPLEMMQQPMRYEESYHPSKLLLLL